MLRQLRASGKHTKAIWWLLTIITVVTFVFGFNFLFGVGDGSGRKRGIVGSVDGSPIAATEYQTAMTAQREAFRRQYGSDPVDRDEKNTEAQAWRTLVTEKLLGRQARAAGLKAYDHEVVLVLETSPPQELISQPAFQGKDGKFDPEKYRAAVRDPSSAFWTPFEELVRRQLPARKLQERLLSSIKLSEPELHEAFLDRFDRVTATMVVVAPDAQARVAPPGPADLDRVYQEYRSRFYSGPRVDLEVLVVPKRYTDDDLRTARQFAQNLVDRSRKGEDFAQLARDYSEGPGAAQGGVVPRIIQPIELGPELASRVAALQPGQVDDPFVVSGRFIIMKLLERVPQPGQPSPGLRLAQIIVRVRPSDATAQGQYAELQKLQARARALKSLGKAATEKGLATMRTGFIDPNNPPPMLASTPELADWGLGAAKLQVSPIIDALDAYVIAQAADVHAGGAVPRDQLTETLRQIAEAEARVEQVKPLADRVAQAMARGQSLEQAAQASGLTAFTLADLTRAQLDPRVAGAPDLVGMLFASAPGRIVGPLREPAGWYFARVDQRVAAPTDSTYEHSKAQLSGDILGARQRTFFNGWLGDLRARARIQDYRAEGTR